MKYRAIVIVILFSIGLSSTAYAQWIKSNGPFLDDLLCLSAIGTDLYAGSEYFGAMLSTNSGTDWTEVRNGLTYRMVTAFAVSDTNLVAGTDMGVYVTPLKGPMNWTPIGPRPHWISALAVSGTDLLAATVGTAGNEVYRTVDGGSLWTRADDGLSGKPVTEFLVTGTRILAATASGGVHVSTDSGTSWTAANAGLTGDVTALALVDTCIFAGTFGDGVFASTDNGSTWTPASAGLTARFVQALAASGKNLFAGTHGGGVYLSTDLGASWNAVSEGLAHGYIMMLAVSKSDLFAGSYGGVWRLPLSALTTSAKDPSTDIPREFGLDQNYPNPFNPSTTITYELPRSSDVRLSVYDMLGREVSLLVNENRGAGVHEVKFDAAGLSSGVYFYRLKAGEFVQTRRLLLLQ